jgi:hypothetical protein
VGLWVIAGLGTVLYTGERWHASGWKHILGLVGIFGMLLSSLLCFYYKTITADLIFCDHIVGDGY